MNPASAPRGGWKLRLGWSAGGRASPGRRLVLLPLSYLFRFGVWARRLGYDAGAFKVTKLDVPVVSVGNIKVGGTGKTPFCRWLVGCLTQRGKTPAIVSRGYGGRSRGPVLVGGAGRVRARAEEVGDEAVMLAKTSAATVVTGRDRVAAARYAVREAAADFLILDDGFQHRRLDRDLDIVLVDGTETGADLLPAGPLREPLSALARAHRVLRTVRSSDPEDLTEKSSFPGAAMTVQLVATSLVVSEAGRWEDRPLAELAGRRGLVVAGVADPAALYRWLRQWELEIDGVIEKPDHYRYTVADWQAVAKAAERVDLVVTTEKDLVKLEQFPFARGKLMAVRMGVAIHDERDLVDEILRCARRGAV